MFALIPTRSNHMEKSIISSNTDIHFYIPLEKKVKILARMHI